MTLLKRILIIFKLYLRILIQLPKTFVNWPTAVLDLFFLKKGQVIYEHKNGIKIYARGQKLDILTIAEIFVFEEYENEKFNIKLRDNDVVVDIGATNGDFALWSNTKSKNLKIYSLEPSKDSFNLLSQNIIINNAHNITIFPYAIAKNASQLKLGHIRYPHNFKLSSSNTDSYELVTTHSIQSFMREAQIKKIDFLKMDCEGEEYEILDEKTIKDLQNARCMVIEFHTLSERRSEFDEIRDTFSKYNFMTSVSQKYCTYDCALLYCRNKNKVYI